MGLLFNSSYPDKFGYYTVGEKKSYSKLEVLEWGEPEWHFNDVVFSAIDWTIEPPFDLWELYKQRVKQIREQYDYVVLMYSGGSDSHNILSAFIETGCKIDEIATFWDYEKSGEKDSYLNAEISRVVIPHIKQLHKEGHEFKFRLIDQIEMNREPFKFKNLNYEYYLNSFIGANALSRGFYREQIQEWKNIIESGKKLVLVWGKEKPFISYDNELNKYYFCFNDQVDDAVGVYVQKNHNKGWYDEYFYWTPDNPLITIKGCHIIKNFLRTCNLKELYENKIGIFGYNPNLNMYLKEKTFQKLIYPKWNTNTFSNGKTFFNNKNRKSIYTPRDLTFLLSNMDIKDRYVSMVNYTVKKYHSKSNFQYNQITMKFSKRYWLE